MNGQEDDSDDLLRCISSPSFMRRAEDDDTNNNMDAVFGAGVQDGGNTINNIMHTTQQIQEPANIYQECPHPMGTQERVHDIQNAPMELDSFMNDFLVSPSVVQPSSSVRISSPRGNPLPEDNSLWDDLLLDILGPPSAPTLTLNPVRDLATEPDPMMNERSTLLVNPHDTQPGSVTPLEVDSGGENLPNNIKSLLKLANTAMNELITLGEKKSPSWKIDSSTKRETLDYQEYNSFFKNGFEKPPGYVIESSREIGTVLMDSLDLVKTFTTDDWINVFAPIVSVASIHKVIPNGYGGPRSGSLTLIIAEFQILSPLVPKKQVKFLRYCNMLRDGSWVIVDFTPRQENLNFSSGDGSYRLPSGVIIQDTRSGYSKVTWIEQMEYNESSIPQFPKLLVTTRIGLGAMSWLTTLQRHCRSLSTLATINLDDKVYQGLSSKVATEIVKLAQRMTINYYLCITDTASPASRWKRNDSGSEGKNKRVVIRKENVGDHTKLVLSAATSVWFPVSKKKMFDFLRNHRKKWDILTFDVTTPIQEKIKIQKSKFHKNEVSLLQIAPDSTVLQETWNDASGALLVYAPVEIKEILASENSDSVQILPSGFSISPDVGREIDPGRSGVGCLVTLGYQVLHKVKPTEDVDQEFLTKVEGLLYHTIESIKSALSI